MIAAAMAVATLAEEEVLLRVAVCSGSRPYRRRRRLHPMLRMDTSRTTDMDTRKRLTDMGNTHSSSSSSTLIISSSVLYRRRLFMVTRTMIRTRNDLAIPMATPTATLPMTTTTTTTSSQHRSSLLPALVVAVAVAVMKVQCFRRRCC